MSAASNNVRHVLFYLGTKPGNLILAEMDDGSYCILRNDQPLHTERWDSGDIAAAAARFQEMKAKLSPPPAES